MREGRFFKRKEIWVPTWKGWLSGFALLLGVTVAVVVALPGFLSPNRPLNARVLVVEGWVSEWSLSHALKLHQTNRYDLLIVTGGPIEKGMHISRYENYGRLGAERLREMGFQGTNLVIVPTPHSEKDRTYHSGLAVAKLLREQTSYRSFDLLSAGVHSRRSWLLYRLAGRPDLEVGVLWNEDPEFDARRWWRTSYGVRSVISEMIGYGYAKFIFQPPAKAGN